MRPAVWIAFSLAMPFANATPGAVDQFNCHEDPTSGVYHCHGSEKESKLSHFLVGATFVIDQWLYDDGPANNFGGFGLEGEWSTRYLAAHASYQWQAHLSGESDYSLSGWALGVKAGNNISRLGTHPYVEAGYWTQAFNRPYGENYLLGGYQFGGGFVYNGPRYAADLRVVYKDTADLEAMWRELGYPTNALNLNFQFGMYFRL